LHFFSAWLSGCLVYLLWQSQKQMYKVGTEDGAIGSWVGRVCLPLCRACRLAKTACKFPTCVILFMRLPQLFHRVSLSFADTLYMPRAPLVSRISYLTDTLNMHTHEFEYEYEYSVLYSWPIVLSLAVHANCCQLGFFSSVLDAV